jgi:hypothetical protein
LVIEETDFSGYANSNPSSSFGNRQSPRRQVGGVRYLPRNLQNPLARSFVDSVAPVQGTIHGSDRDVSEFGNEVDSAPLLLHPLAPVTHAGVGTTLMVTFDG